MNQVFLWLRSGTLRLILLAGFFLLLWGTVAPVGTLVWWLQQDSEKVKGQRDRLRASDLESGTGDRPDLPIDCYIVFLTGVGDFSANQLSPGENVFLDRLTQQHPYCVAVRDVFPYSAANESLDGDRWLTPLWQAAQEADGWLENADVLIKIRNLWRFALSTDNRYGPVYNQGIANAIVDQMNAAYPIENTESPLRLILIGTSGGVQVALGAADYLDLGLVDELVVISVGGDFSGAEGFTAADQVYHLYGRQDWIEDLSKWLFPQRWPWTVGSAFNRAQRQGRYHTVLAGPQAHSGAEGYFSLEPVESKENTTYLDLTLEAVNQLPIWD